MSSLFVRLWPDPRLRYLTVGTLNTVWGYGVSIILHALLGKFFSILWIGILIQIVGISFSFVTYKIFVFKTKGYWLAEYLRSYVIYGFSALISIGLLCFFIEKLYFSFWIAQALCIILVTIISYIGNKMFTFRI